MINFDQQLFNNSPGVLEDKCSSTYTMHEGMLVIPVMDAAAVSPVVVRVHAPYTVRKSIFNYMKGGCPPLVPSPINVRGYSYLGGGLTVTAPKVDSSGTLLYEAWGEYDFVGTTSLREHGKIRFDAHGALTAVDFLGYNMAATEQEIENGSNSWTSPFFDLALLGSARILG